MFDTILAHKSIIDPFLKKEWISFFHTGEGDYYYFQTKDLENFLWTYYIEADKKIYVEKYRFNEEEEKIKRTVKQEDLVTANVNFYESFATDTEEIWLEFKATIVRGVLEDIVIDKCRVDSLEELKEKSKIAEKWRQDLEAQWEMKVIRFLQYIEWKAQRIWYKFAGQHYFNFKQWLRGQVDKKIGPFPNIYE